MSPCARSLAEMRSRGFELVDVVEHFNFFTKRRKDLFGIGDILCVSPDKPTTIVQATSGDHVSHRVEKITESDVLPILQRAGVKVLVHGWRKNAKGRYVLREVELS